MLPCQKHLFSLPEDTHYLNCAYMSPLSKRVETAGRIGLSAKRNPASIKANDFFETSKRVRERFGTLINAAPSTIAIIPSASYGLAAVARNTPVEKGQRIVIVEEQFPSNVYTWMRLAEENGAHVHIVPAPAEPKNRSRTWNERLLEAIDEKTAIVALAPVHWADGARFNLAAIGKRAREVGAAFILDGTQSVGALPFDAASIKPDALICAGYKWLLGPYGIGAAHFGPRYDNGIPLEENWIARKGSENFGGLVQYTSDYQTGAIRYDVGERSNFILLPMLEAALDHLLEWGPANIQAYCGELINDFTQIAQAHGYLVEDAAWRASHLFGVRVRENYPMERLMEALDTAGISVSIRGSAIRISPHVYNDKNDLAALTEVFVSVALRGRSPARKTAWPGEAGTGRHMV